MGRDIVIIWTIRPGGIQEQIAVISGMTQGRVSQIINNTNFGKINNFALPGATGRAGGKWVKTGKINPPCDPDQQRLKEAHFPIELE